MGALAGRRIVVPETREIELLARMLEKHGATVLRCPLVAIRDTDDPAPVLAWIERFIDDPPDDLILFTGEGLQRLHKLAGPAGISKKFVAALGQVRKITRGPKPARRLRELGLKPDLPVEPPTTAGIVAALSKENLTGRRVAVQLYPDAPPDLIDFLRGAGAAVDPVLPYVYASSADEARVLDAIREMAAGRIDLVAFTSSPQLRRLKQVARANRCDDALAEGFAKTKLAAVGPVVAAAIEAAGGTVAVAPPDNFHLRPMVNAIVAALERPEPGPALAAVIKKYSGHPQFLGIEIRDPNQAGAVDDALLHLAAWRGALDDMEVLIGAGAEVNMPGDLGNTPLHDAAAKGHTQAVELLLSHGADPSVQNEFGETASDAAALRGHATIVRLLEARNRTAS